MLAGRRGPTGYASAALAQYFGRFGISASVVDARAPDLFYPVYERQLARNLVELRYGREDVRSAYNQRQLARAARERRTVVGVLDGYSDLFVPMVDHGSAVGFVVCGPFLRRRPTRQEIVKQWERLSGRTAGEGDPGLLAYARVAIHTPVLDDHELSALEKLARTLADLSCGSIDPGSVLPKLGRFVTQITQAYPYPSMWDAAAGLTGVDTNAAWQTRFRRAILGELETRELPSSALLVLPRFAAEVDNDPIARGEATAHLQRQAVRLACTMGNTLSGRHADDGFYVLIGTDEPRADERRATVRAASERVRALARDNGAAVRMGASIGCRDPNALPQRYREALVAAEWATYENRALVFFGDRRLPAQPLGAPAWHRSVESACRAIESGAVAAARVEIDPIVSDVLSRTAGSLPAVQAYFEAAFLDCLAVVEPRASLDRSFVDSTLERLAGALRAAPTAHAAAAAFRVAMLDLLEASERPSGALRTERIHRAAAYIERLYAEPLTLARVAKEAGLSPTHFSRLFKRSQGIGFARFLLECRLARALHLLKGSTLPVHRVARECGFSSYVCFERAFRRRMAQRPTDARAGRRDKG
jgi:AraC-like DNA-binding protein